MADIDPILAMLADLPPEKVWIGSGAGPAGVAAAEASIGTVFPTQLRSFTSAVGWGGPDPLTIFGVDNGHDLGSTRYPAIVRYNEGRHGVALPAGYLIIASSGDGGWMITKAYEDGPVLVWYGDAQAPDELEVAAESLAEYLLGGLVSAADED